MSRHVHIINGVVVAVLDSPLGFTLQVGTVLPHASATVGQAYDGATFSTPAPVYEWKISIGAFLDRLGGQKSAFLASSDATVQAIWRELQVRPFLDLAGNRGKIGNVLDFLIGKGLALNKSAILDTPVASDEKPGAS